MSSKSTLILQHLLDCKILNPSDAEEILPIFSKDVASTVAVTIVTSFTNNGTIPELNTTFSIDWTMQCVAYCLSLSTLFQKSLFNSMAIFHHWLTDPNFFKDDKVWNAYAQRIFIYLSQILQNRKDDSTPEIRNTLIIKLFDDLMDYQKDVHNRFNDETWNILIRILIGSADFLLSNDKNMTYNSDQKKKTLFTRCFELLFEIIINSELTSTSIWSDFFVFCSKWSSNETFIKSWILRLQIIFKNLLKDLYENKNQSDINFKKKLNLTGFHLHQFIYCINCTVVMKDTKLFSDLSENIQNLAQKMTDLAQSQSNDLYWPLPPSTFFFKLFGHWCFNSFRTSLLECQTVLVKVLMNIAGNWEIDPEWSKVLLSTLMKVISTDKQQLKQTIMRNGHHLLKQFISNDIIDQFSKCVDNYSPSGPACLDFWFSYATLLCEISEKKAIKLETINDFLQKSGNQKAKLAVLTILLRQSSSDFVTTISKLVGENFNLIKSQQDSLNSSQSNDLNLTPIDFIVMIYILVASSQPFIKIDGIEKLLNCLLDLTSNLKVNKSLVEAFFIMISSVARWRNAVFHPEFEDKLISFLIRLDQETKNRVDEKINIDQISKTICGRPIDRNVQKVDVSKNLVSFMVGNKSIVTIYDDDQKDDKFVIHVREKRGFFMWELKDVLDQRSYSPQKVEGELPSPTPIQYNIISPEYKSAYDNVTVTEEQIKNSKTLDETFDKPSNHDQKSYISMYLEKHKLRHKAIDFLIQTQLSSAVKKISENVEEVLNNFDKIEVVPVVKIPLFHTTSSGFTDSKEQTPLFKRFIALLGPLNEKEKVPESKLGLIDVLYSPDFENKGTIGIVFNECSLGFNYKHPSIPKCKLLFFVKPYDSAFYLIRCVCENPLFFCDVSEERMISAENLASAIAMAIFQYISLTDSAFMFSKDLEREEFLSQIKTESMSPLEIINGYTLDEFQK